MSLFYGVSVFSGVGLRAEAIWHVSFFRSCLMRFYLKSTVPTSVNCSDRSEYVSVMPQFWGPAD